METACTDTSWCRAWWETEAAQILTSGCRARSYPCLPSPAPVSSPRVGSAHQQTAPSRICNLCPTGTPAAVRVNFISTSAKPVLVYTEKDEEKSGHSTYTILLSPLSSAPSQFEFRSLQVIPSRFWDFRIPKL